MDRIKQLQEALAAARVERAAAHAKFREASAKVDEASQNASAE